MRISYIANRKDIIKKLFENINKDTFRTAFGDDLKSKENCFFIATALARKTPAVLGLKSTFKHLKNVFPEVNEKVIYLLLF